MFLKIRIEEDKYEKFQTVCSKKDKTMSEVLRNFINYYTDHDNTIVFNLDDKMINDVLILCKDKKIRFDDLIKNLITMALKNKDKINFNEQL